MLGGRRKPHHSISSQWSLVHCDHRNAITTPNDNVAVSVCLSGRTTGQTTGHSPMPSHHYHGLTAAVKTTFEQVERREACGDVLLETWGDGTSHQELRITLFLLLPRLEQHNDGHAKDNEMPGLQEFEKGGQRTRGYEIFSSIEADMMILFSA
jgi:hypothetical protein